MNAAVLAPRMRPVAGTAEVPDAFWKSLGYFNFSRLLLAALLLAAGEPKKRLALPNSRILIHQPSMGGLSGQATDIDIHAREILRMREITNQLLSKHSGQKLEKVEKDVERDFIMNAQQAKEYGIIDDILYKTK